MERLLLEYKTEIVGLFSELFRVVAVFSIALAIVYVFGRMFEIVKGYISRNVIAFMVIITLNLFYSVHFVQLRTMDRIMWDVLVYSSFSILLYVLVGFHLYDRCDDFLDRKFGRNRSNMRKKK